MQESFPNIVDRGVFRNQVKGRGIWDLKQKKIMGG